MSSYPSLRIFIYVHLYTNSLYLPTYFFLSLSLSDSLFLCLSTNLFLYLFISLSLSLFLSHSLSLSISLALSLSLSLCVCLPFSLCLSHTLILSLFYLLSSQVMTYFKDFIEDYNTATMPHEKYYNYEAWEMKEYRKAQLDKINKTGKCP